MFDRTPLRWRLALLTGLLIAVCCVCLSALLGLSAYRMADSIAATPLQPAQGIGGGLAEPPATSAPSLLVTSAQQARKSYFSESLFFTAVAVLAGGFFTYYVSGKALEPVRALNEQVKNVNVHNLNEALDVPASGDEIAELARSFNDMTEKLDRAFSAQKRFSAHAAHEPHPLAVMQTKLDVFRKKGGHTPEEYDGLIAAFHKQLGRLRGLVAELLDIANLEDGAEMQAVCLADILAEAEAELACIAQAKNISLHRSGAGCPVLGDPVLLYRAFYNLIENGIKYNVPGGSVTVETSLEHGAAVVTVSDTGPGIPEHMKGQVFEPFFRVDKSRSREMGGAGLGLALVDGIVHKHGGAVTVADREGGGSRFVVTLPGYGPEAGAT